MALSATMQTLVLTRLAQMLGDAGVHPIADNSRLDRMNERRFTIDYRASNVGTVRIIEGYTLRALTEVYFDFQADGFRFGPMMNPVASHDYGKEPRPGMSPWVYGTPLDALVKVRDYLLDTQAVRAA